MSEKQTTRTSKGQLRNKLYEKKTFSKSGRYPETNPFTLLAVVLAGFVNVTVWDDLATLALDILVLVKDTATPFSNGVIEIRFEGAKPDVLKLGFCVKLPGSLENTTPFLLTRKEF